MLEGRDAILRHPDMCDKWEPHEVQQVQGQVQGQYMGQSNPQYQYRLEDEWIETALQRRTWETQVDEKWGETAMAACSPESQYRAT